MKWVSELDLSVHSQGEAERERKKEREKEELYATLTLHSKTGPWIYGILWEVQQHSPE